MAIVHREPHFPELKMVLQRRGLPSRVPFYELFADREIMTAVLGREAVSIQDEVEFQLALGYDYVRGRLKNANLSMAGEVSTSDTAPLSRGQRTYRVAGMHSISSWEDFARYPWPDPAAVDYSECEELGRIMPDGMQAIVLTGHVLEDPMGLFGFEGLAYLMADDPALVEAVFTKVGSFYESIYESCCDLDAVGAMLISDDLGFKTGTMISPVSLRKLVFPWYQRYTSICHAHDIPVILHSCGMLEEIMDDLIDTCRVDAKHSFEDQIMPVGVAKERYGHRVALLGGLDVDFLCRAGEAEVRRRTREILEDCMPGGGYALGTGNSVANYIPVRNYLAMLDEGDKIGRY